MRRILLSLLLLVALLAAACGGNGGDSDATPTATDPATDGAAPTATGTAPATPTAAACSTSGTDVRADFSENPDLTGQANETRRAVARAAVDCDDEALVALADEDFTYSFGETDDPASYWRELEAAGTPVMSILATLLRLDTHVEVTDAEGDDPLVETLYTWPRAYLSDDPAARSELVEAFGEAQVAEWYTPEGEYLGWRVGIRGDGAWIFYVAGD